MSALAWHPSNYLAYPWIARVCARVETPETCEIRFHGAESGRDSHDARADYLEALETDALAWTYDEKFVVQFWLESSYLPSADAREEIDTSGWHNASSSPNWRHTAEADMRDLQRCHPDARYRIVRFGMDANFPGRAS